MQQSLFEGCGLNVSGLQAIQIRPEGNSVWHGFVDRTPVIVRVAGGRNAMAMERWMYDRLGREGIPCPEVLAYIEQLPGIGLPCLVMTRAEGIRLSDAPEKLQGELHFKLGAVLRHIHAIELDGFGELVKSGSQIRGRNDSWAGHWPVDEYLHGLEYGVRHDLLSPDEVTLLKSNFQRIRDYRLPRGALLHVDLSGNNTLVTGREISGIIDVENAMSGAVVRHCHVVCLAGCRTASTTD